MIIACILLPESVITQIPKLFAFVPPTLLGYIGAVMQFRNKDNPKNGLLIIGVRILILGFSLIMNL